MSVIAPPITDTVIETSIVRAVESVFDTMVSQKIVFVEKTSAPAVNGAERPQQIFGSVGFVGDASGLIYLCLTEDFAKYLTGRILSMSPGEVEMHGAEVVTDAIGEVTNMTVGGFKNTLCDLGHTCKLTLPTIVRGQNLTVAAIKSATRHVFHFDCAGQRLSADIQMKSE